MLSRGAAKGTLVLAPLRGFVQLCHFPGARAGSRPWLLTAAAPRLKRAQRQNAQARATLRTSPACRAKSFLLCRPGFRIDTDAQVLLGVRVEKEAKHHLMVRLRTVAHRRFRIRVVRIEIRIVVMSDAFESSALFQTHLAGLPAIRHLPGETVVRNDQQRLGFAVGTMSDEGHVLAA